MIYKDFTKDIWDDFLNISCDKKLYIFGAGESGLKICKLIKHGIIKIKPYAFLDNNKSGFFEGYPIYNPREIQTLDGESYVVLISLDRPGAVVSQLLSLGCVHYFSWFWMNEDIRVNIQQDLSHNHNIQLVKGILRDERSIQIIEAIVQKRKDAFPDYSDIVETGSDIFPAELFSSIEDEIFLDGGGFNGDSLEEFFDWTKGHYKEVHVFEPDKKNVALLKSKSYRYHNLHVWENGLWNQNTTMPFASGNDCSSHIVNGGGNSNINCVSLDQLLGYSVPFTFIKLDIEGAEIPALIGMKNIIKKYNPRLAICIYHKPDDLWEIPLIIHNLVPEYELYIRHYRSYCEGTVLFAKMP